MVTGCLKVISQFVKKHTSERVHLIYDKEVLRHVRSQLGGEEIEGEDPVPLHKLLIRALMVMYILAVSQRMSHTGLAAGLSFYSYSLIVRQGRPTCSFVG